MIQGTPDYIMHSEEFALYESVTAAAREAVSAFSHGRDPSHESLKKLKARVDALDATTDKQIEAWDDEVRNA
jgi:hypothetical protein